MKTITKSTMAVALGALVTIPAGGAFAQQATQTTAAYDDNITVTGQIPTDLTGMAEGPQVEGIISARRGNRIQVTSEDGVNTVVNLSEATEIRGRGGFLGLNRTEISAGSLMNGLPVSIETVMWNGALVANKVRFSNSDMETAAMIHGGTAQQFAAHDAAIEENAAATEALRGRMGDIDQYNIRGTTNVYFDTGKWNLSPSAQQELCAAASEANGIDNALLLVVGYTDDVGDQDYNQTLSERRAGRVVNFLQQECDWQPWRMLTPTGMAESDPLADNTTDAGRAQNRRVSVNILVSKAVENL